MSDTRHEFIITATDRTKAAFDSAKANLLEIKKTALSVQSLIAAGLGGAGVVSFTSEMAEMGRSSLIAADNLNTTTEQITSLQYAASKFNVDGDSMNDVLKDMSVRVQEFATMGSGEAADFFETLNLNVKDFVDLAPDELLYKVAQELDGMSDASARVYLDQLGSDNLVALLPLLRNNAAGLREMQDEAYATNKVLKQTDAIKLSAISNEINVMQNAAKTLSQQLAAEFEPTVKAISERFNEFASDGDAVSDTLDTMTTAGILVASIYAGRMTSAFAASAQAKYADTVASRQNAAANLEEAKAALAKSEVKLSSEQLAYKNSIAAKQQEIIESEKVSAANLAQAKSAQVAAAADVEAAAATKSHTDQMKSLVSVSQSKVAAANAQLIAAKAKLTEATKRAEKAERAHQTQLAKNADTIRVVTSTTKKLDLAKNAVIRDTKAANAAQVVYNNTMRVGTGIAKGFGAALGLMGGPIGLITTAIGFGATWALTNVQTSDSIELLKASAEDLDKTLSKSSAGELGVMLADVRREIGETSTKMKELNSIEIDDGDIAAQSKQYKRSEKLKLESDKINKLRAVEIQLAAEYEKKETAAAKIQADFRAQIASQTLRTNIAALEKSVQTADQIRSADYEKQQQEIKSFYDKKKTTLKAELQSNRISQQQYNDSLMTIEGEYTDLSFKVKQKYELKTEQLELAQHQKQMSAFSDNYTKREQLTLAHQQRVLQYMQDTGITSDKDARVIAYQKESYDYQLKQFKDYRKDILRGYDDYGKSAVQKEKSRYAEEIKELKKHLRDKDITQRQYTKAESVAEARHLSNAREARLADFNETANKQIEFNNLFVSLADSKNKELAAIGKAAAIYNIGVTTAQGVMQAWATAMQLGPIAGPIVGGILSAALIGYGVEQVANVNSQTYHTGGIAGQDSDNYSSSLANNEIPAVLIRGEEVLTQADPRHRNNLTMGKKSSSESQVGSTVNQISIGDIKVTVDASKATTSSSIGQSSGEQIATQIVAVLQSRLGQKLVYSGVSAEAGRYGGKIKGVR